MTGRATAIQGGLAALGLITAHFTWQREPERAPGEVAVIDAGKNDVSRIHYEDDATSMDLERHRDGAESPVWLHVVDRGLPVKAADKPGDKKVDKLAKQPGVTSPPRDLRGSEAAEKLYDQFAPLHSPRAFGVLDASKLKELGLDAPKKKLIVNFKGDTREFAIGQPPGSTTGESYLRDTRDGRVYLMPHGMAGDLAAGSTRLVDRKLHGFEPNEFDKLVVTVGDKKRELVQSHRENVHATQLASAKTPDKPDQMAHNWHDALWRLFPTDVLGKGEEPKEGAPAQAVRVEYFDHGKSVGWIEIAKAHAAAMSEPGAPPSAGDALYARTERTAGWVKLRGNPQLLTDAEKVAATQ